MAPTLKDRDRILTTRILPPKVGNIVVVKHPEYGLRIKRVADQSEREVVLIDDNKEASIDSENLGWVQNRYVKGTVIHSF